MSRPTIKSDFARALEALLDDTRLFKRREWAKLLGIKEAAISQWLSDDTIPRATNLNMLFTVIERSSDANKKPLEEFKIMAQLPALNVSPKNGRRMLPTVWEYMKRPVFSELSNKLSRLTIEQQEQLLEEQFSHGVKKSIDGELSKLVDADIASLTSRPSASQGRSFPTTMPTSQGGYGKSQINPLANDASVTFSLIRDRSDSELKLTHRSQSAYITPAFKLHSDNASDSLIGPNLRWEVIAEKTNHIIVLGLPGMGKTSFLLRICDLLKSNSLAATLPWSGRLPVYVPLHRIPSIQTADEFWNAISGTAPAHTNRDNILLLLDGFDEVLLERRNGLVKAISELLETNPKTGVIVTSRPTPDIRHLGRMTRCTMQSPPDSRLLALAYEEASSAIAGTALHWDDAVLQVGSCFRERPDVFRAVSSPLLLSYSARLFARRSLTACHDVDLLDSCLVFLVERWDEVKEVVRPRTSWTSARSLYQWLSRLSYHSLLSHTRGFTRESVNVWLGSSSGNSIADTDLQAVAESTGIIALAGNDICGNNHWEFVQKTFQEFLAARYVIESSRDATNYLIGPIEGPRMSSVLRFACSMTNDATPLLAWILKSTWTNETSRMATLADMMAQQFMASSEVVEQSSLVLVGWLEALFDGWTISTSDEESELFPQPKWKITARSKQPTDNSTSKHGKDMLQVIQALHRSRLSPAKQPLAHRLAESKNEVVQSLGESLNVEGYLQGRAFVRGGSDLLAAEVCEI